VADKAAADKAFAIWVTGLPASGKSTIVKALSRALTARGVNAAVLESDVLRTVFTPHPRYDQQERTTFYRQLVYVGTLLTKHGVPVIFDATANLRMYRDQAREQIPRFLEVYVECPLEVCMARDPKGIYRAGREGTASIVPGLQAAYEPPANPDVVVRGDLEAPETAAERIVSKLIGRTFIAS
jgi:adenylylsulfate kinase